MTQISDLIVHSSLVYVTQRSPEEYNVTRVHTSP